MDICATRFACCRRLSVSVGTKRKVVHSMLLGRRCQLIAIPGARDGSTSASCNDEALSKVHAGPPSAGHVHAKLRVAPCASADLRTFFNPSPQQLQRWRGREQKEERPSSPAGKMVGTEIEDLREDSSFLSYRLMGGTGGLWEVTATGAGVLSLRPGDLAIPSIPTTIPNTTGTRPSMPGPAFEGTGARSGSGRGITVLEDISSKSETSGTALHCSERSESLDGDADAWRLTTTLSESSLLRVPNSAVSTVAGTGLTPEVLAHVSTSVATAIRLLEDFAPLPAGRLEKGDRIVVTGAFSAVAQMLLQIAAARGLESVCLVSNEKERELAERLGTWKAVELKEFKAMRMNDACLVADGEGGVLGFTAARALGFRGHYVSYADASGDGVRGFSLARWMRQRSSGEARALVREALQAATEGQLRLDDTQEFSFSDAVTAIEIARTPGGGPVVFK